MLDEELAFKLQAEEEEEDRLVRQREEEANIVSWDNKSKLFVQLLEERKNHFTAMRAQEMRNKPPTKAQKRNAMSTYLKNIVGYKHNQLKNKSFDDIQKLFDKAMKRVNTFVDMDTELVEGSEDMAEKEVSIDDPVTIVSEVVTTANVEVSTANLTAATITNVELTLAQTLAELKSARPKTNGVVMQEPSELITTTTIPSKDKGKGYIIYATLRDKKTLCIKKSRREEEQTTNKSSAKEFMCTYLKNMEGWKPKDLKNKSFANIQDLFDKAMKRVNKFIDMDTELVKECSKKAEAEIA
ncbi:hypothetical protein Tco_1326364 [Tanacetum coccineum]